MFEIIIADRSVEAQGDFLEQLWNYVNEELDHANVSEDLRREEARKMCLGYLYAAMGGKNSSDYSVECKKYPVIWDLILSMEE